jgi:hypothetical protein
MLKSHLVCNATLSRIATIYKLPDRLNAAPAALYSTRSQVKTRASIFEAYVAALFYSYFGDRNGDDKVASHGDEGETAPGKVLKNVGIGRSSWLCADVPKVRFESECHELEGSKGDEESDNEDASEEPDASLQGNDSGDEDSGEAEPASNVQGEQATDSKTTLSPSGPIPESPAPSDDLELTDPSEGQHSSSSPTDSSTSFTIRPPRRARTRGEAYDYLDAWLRPLYTPLAYWALDCMKLEQARLNALPGGSPDPDEMDIDLKCPGAKAMLNTHVIGKMGGKCLYIPDRVTEVPSLWKVTCVVEDSEGMEWWVFCCLNAYFIDMV